MIPIKHIVKEIFKDTAALVIGFNLAILVIVIVVSVYILNG